MHRVLYNAQASLIQSNIEVLKCETAKIVFHLPRGELIEWCTQLTAELAIKQVRPLNKMDKTAVK